VKDGEVCLVHGEEDTAKEEESPKGQPQEGGSSPFGRWPGAAVTPRVGESYPRTTAHVKMLLSACLLRALLVDAPGAPLVASGSAVPLVGRRGEGHMMNLLIRTCLLVAVVSAGCSMKARGYTR
jgi:hypothetical protein